MFKYIAVNSQPHSRCAGCFLLASPAQLCLQIDCQLVSKLCSCGAIVASHFSFRFQVTPNTCAHQGLYPQSVQRRHVMSLLATAPFLLLSTTNANVYVHAAGVACVSVATQQLHKPFVWHTSTPPACLQAWRRSERAAQMQSSWLELGWPGSCMHTSACSWTHKPDRLPLAACSHSPSSACRSSPILLVCLLLHLCRHHT